MGKTNHFCQLDDLKNEADVEQSFLRRFLEYAGYTDRTIRSKASLANLSVNGMRGQQANYRPDFALKVNHHVRWILEAKAPGENLDKWVWQPRGYCQVLNGELREGNPVKFFLLSNSIVTRLYQWDVNNPILELSFEDFVPENKKFKKLIDILKPKAFTATGIVDTSATFKLDKSPLSDVNAAFAWCHQHIYKKDNMSQAAAFTEFVKVIFLKLLSDRKIRDKYPDVIAEDTIEVPTEDVKFSLLWIQEQERNTPNPIDTIQFRDFILSMEKEIEMGKRKRIFNSNEKITLSPETIRGVVKRIEHMFLFGVDVDLNGRLFETFLNATMRGKDLGQYFTPRSVVKLGVKLANLRVNSLTPEGGRHTDLVVDACCGTGGFLIDALSEMWNKINSNESLDSKAKDELKELVATKQIVGVDVGREPPLARIARLNMYLHGDGGGSIYQVDALDKKLRDKEIDSPEITKEKVQLRSMFKKGGFADVVITNPPFAKTYERRLESEAAVLDEYKIGVTSGGEKRTALRSSLMFIERYYDLLKVGGRLVTVIDDGILNGASCKWFRTYIRDHFIVKAVISLPGDAFQRSKARVKTSLLVAEKRDLSMSQTQPPVFMYGCEYVGIDDPSRQRTLPIDRKNRAAAVREIATVGKEFLSFLSGEGNPKYVVLPERISDRLDVKSCLMTAGRMVAVWTDQGREVLPLEALARPKVFSEEHIIETKESDEFVTYLRVKYDGYAEAGDEIVASDTDYSYLYRVEAGDIVISNIAANYGSVALVPAELEGCVITNEYTVLRTLEGVSPIALWLLLRSPEIRAEMLITATGISRNRVKWSTLRNIQIPKPDQGIVDSVVELTEQAREAESTVSSLRSKAISALETPLELANEGAFKILRAFKPPK